MKNSDQTLVANGNSGALAAGLMRPDAEQRPPLTALAALRDVKGSPNLRGKQS
jgi:hypothetical protein